MPDTETALRVLAALKNLGEKTAQWLLDAGVRSKSELAKLGAIEVCKRMLQAGHPVSVVAAYAIEGALTDTHWNEIPASKKLELQRLFAIMKRELGPVEIRRAPRKKSTPKAPVAPLAPLAPRKR
jgi:DNA transformation protein